MMDIDLKLCPFCGKKPTVIEGVLDKYGIARLELDCCMRFDIWSDEMMYSDGGKAYVRLGMDAVEKWNRRAGEQE